MKIETKYGIGEKLFWIDRRDGICRINYDTIKEINIGGKDYKRYEISYTTRSEKELYKTFEEAKEKTIKQQKEFNKRVLEIIEEYTE